MFAAIYFIINMLVTLLQISNFISINSAILIVLTTGLILLLLEINKVKRLRRKAGEVLFQLESELKTSPISQLIYTIIGLSFVIIFLSMIFLNKITNESFLNYSIFVYLIIYNIYLDTFTNAFFTENGLFVRGKMIQWTDIKSYKWQVPRFGFLKGYTKLVIKQEARLWINELQLMTNDSQKSKLNKLLQQKISLSCDIE